MLLTVDIGNSNICFAQRDPVSGKQLLFERIHTNREKKAEEYTCDIRDLLAFNGFSADDITELALSSVVPRLTPEIEKALSMLFPGVRLIKVSSDINLDYRINVYNPSELGADILCDVSGALTKYPAPCIVFDLGTATVCSFTSKDRVLEGVIISPGIRTSLISVTKKASALTDIVLDAPHSSIGTNTADSLKSGILYGTAGMIDGLSDRIMKEYHAENAEIILTGGLSTTVAPYCRKKVHIEKNLLMLGLERISELNP